MTEYARTARNKVRRHPERGAYDSAAIDPIVDGALLCHVGFVVEGQPFVIPTLHARDGDTILLHGAAGSRLLKHAATGAPLCITVTHLDGLVLARSVFNHSINYRSAVLFGVGQVVDDPAEKLDALLRFTERLLPGRWDDAREPTAKEIRATGVVAVTIESASAKVRGGPPIDDEEDLALPVWAGVLPVTERLGTPLPAPEHDFAPPLPEYLARFLTARLE
jgi:nitroimidazol reductase NimA-like FMN-containing flavoprotein (pyridoxamine 5'-phosphate oxidase superfamily)